MTEATLARLRQGGSDRFVDLLIDDLLDRPVHELVDPAWMARQLVAAARSAAADPRVESTIRERVHDARRRVSPGKLPLPPELRKPLRDVLARPYVPDRALVGRLLDHDAVRGLLRHLFQDLLVAFARKLRPPVPLPGGSPFGGKSPLGALGKLGGGMLGAVGEEVERQVESKAREFMDAAVHKLVDKMADRICERSHEAEYGALRAHMLDVVLDTDAQTFAGELEKLDPDALVATSAAAIRSYVGRDNMEAEAASIIRATVELAGNRTPRELLEGTEDHALGLVRDLLRQRARALVDTPAFAAWWDEMNAP
ncbi:MAG: hypothetical protein FJ102_26355 [Deltaproteobacteria bacterium]|nr:hypothetical protein [Deltaproteobacteria bacterium]